MTETKKVTIAEDNLRDRTEFTKEGKEKRSESSFRKERFKTGQTILFEFGDDDKTDKNMKSRGNQYYFSPIEVIHVL